MPYVQQEPFFAVSRGEMRNTFAIKKFGRNPNVGTSLSPVTVDGIYRTPQVGGEQQLRVKAGNVNDDVGGTGAWSVQLEGVDAAGNYLREVIPTNGTSAGALSTNAFLRLWRVRVYQSGSYASSTVGSHAADVVIEDSGGNEWADISLYNGFPEGSSQIAAFTVPNGFTAYIKNIILTADSSKPVSVSLFSRANILETSAPYSPMRTNLEVGPFVGETYYPIDAPLGPFFAGTDFGFMASVATGTSSVQASFAIILDKDPSYAQPIDFLA